MPAVVVPLLLAGCGGEDPEPIMPTAEPSGTEEPSEAAEVEPESEPRTEDAAIKAAKRWLFAAADASNSGDVTPLRNATDSACAACETVISAIEDRYAEGGRIETQRPEVLSVGVPVAVRRDYAVPIRINKPVETLINADGSRETVPAAEITFEFRMLWSGGRWLVERLSIVG